MPPLCLCREKTFHSKCNQETVALEDVTDPTDQQWLHDTLQDFVKKTGSEKAQSILDSWPQACADFVKVFPYEYQRALKELEEENTKEQALQEKLENTYGEDIIVSEEALKTPKDKVSQWAQGHRVKRWRIHDVAFMS